MGREGGLRWEVYYNSQLIMLCKGTGRDQTRIQGTFECFSTTTVRAEQTVHPVVPVHWTCQGWFTELHVLSLSLSSSSSSSFFFFFFLFLLLLSVLLFLYVLVVVLLSCGKKKFRGVTAKKEMHLSSGQVSLLFSLSNF